MLTQSKLGYSDVNVSTGHHVPEFAVDKTAKLYCLTSELERLAETVRELHYICGDLEQKLEPIRIIHPATQTNDVEKEANSGSELRAMIKDQIDYLVDLRYRMTQLHADIDL